MNKRDVYKKLGSQLIEKGQWFLKEAFNLKIKRTINKLQITYLFSDMGFSVNELRFADFQYSVIDLNVMKDIIKYSWIDRKDYISEVHDCLLPNTPLLVKIDGKVQIKAVQELSCLPENTFVLDKSLITGESRWTRINWVKEKESNKDIITIKKRNGFIQTTEDHKFYLRKKWTKVGEVERIGWNKMSFTHNNNWDMFSNNEPIDEDLAYTYGVFMADGTCRCYQTKTTDYGWSWHIDMFQKEALERCKKGIEKAFKIPMEIVLYDSQKKGSVRGGFTARRDMFRLKAKKNYGNGRKLVELFEPILYNENREKIIPSIILNANKDSKLAFMEGFLIGDGCLVRDGYQACCKSPTALLGLQIIANKINWDSSVGYDKRSDCPVISLYPNRLKLNVKKRNFIRENRGTTKVYDINTDSGHFFAGNFLVHNCDDFALEFKAHLSGIYNINSVALAKGIKVMLENGKEIWHRACIFLAVEGNVLKAYLLETQTGKFIEIENDLPVAIGDWTYSLSEIEF